MAGTVDGAAVFDAEGVLRRLRVRLIPGCRYSRQDPFATVVAVSEDVASRCCATARCSATDKVE